MKKGRQFEATQSWKVSLLASQAQSVVDLGVRNGANEVGDAEWGVVDPVALQAKASGAALAKARAVAEQMAKGLGAKLGELVYASNRAPVGRFWRDLSTTQLQTESADVVSRNEGTPKLTLFPQKVKGDATVYAVFAIE
jgi:uncharacterized protein YggE